MEKDRVLRGSGGHYCKSKFIYEKKIGKENLRLMNAIHTKKATINFRQMEQEEKQTERIKQSISMFPKINGDLVLPTEPKKK